jgi:hypothetical protein
MRTTADARNRWWSKEEERRRVRSNARGCQEQGRGAIWKSRGSGVVRGEGNRGRGGEAMTGRRLGEAEATPR